MDKATVYKEWLEATDDAILALADWRSQLADWQARGGEAEPGDFDANFQNLANDGLDTWTDVIQTGGGIDLLAAIVEGGTICPTCDGNGLVRYSYLPETCPTCGGVGGLAAGDPACTCSEPGAPATLAGDHAGWCVAVGG